MGAKVADDVKPPRAPEPIVQAGKVLNAKLVEKLVEAGVEKIPVRGRGAGGPPHRPPASWTRRAARCWSAPTPSSPRRVLTQVMGRRVAPFKLLVLSPGQDRRLDVRDAGARPRQEPRRGAGRDLPQAAAGRSAHRGVGPRAVPRHVHGPAPLRPGPGRPLHDQQEAQHRGAGSTSRRCAARTSSPSSGTCCMVKLGSKPDRRHRPPRQPPGALGRRAAGEPVPGRSHADGAGGQGADVDLRHHQPDAPRPDQRQAGLGGGQGVLRLLAALAVHGPDEPAGRADPQAPAVRPGAARSQPGARRVRGARRAPDPLRAHLPHRDAGRPEHRPHLLAVDVRPDQRVRLHRDALPQGRQRAG